MLNGINHNGIVVSDLERAIDFYTNILGLELVDRRERCAGPISQVLGYENAHIKVADVVARDGRVIELVCYLNPVADRRQTEERSIVGAGHVAFNVDDIDSTFSYLVQNGAKALNAPVVVAIGKKVCYLQDPFGNWLELIQQN